MTFLFLHSTSLGRCPWRMVIPTAHVSSEHRFSLRTRTRPTSSFVLVAGRRLSTASPLTSTATIVVSSSSTRVHGLAYGSKEAHRHLVSSLTSCLGRTGIRYQVSGRTCRSQDTRVQKQSVRGMSISDQFLNRHLAPALRGERQRGRVECPTAASLVQIVNYSMSEVVFPCTH